MRVSAKDVKGKKVYTSKREAPIGVVCDVLADESCGRIVGYMIKSLSLIPLESAVDREDIKTIDKEKIILREGAKPESPEGFKKRKNTKLTKTEEVKSVMMPNLKKRKAGDISFDFETGEMCDIVVSKGIFGTKKRIFTNKIYLKDKVIYLKEEGGDESV